MLAMGAATSAAILLPQVISETYGLPLDLIPRGGLVEHAKSLAKAVPYIIGIVIGMLVGMEIPLIARMRETLHERHLVHNVGTIYGTDYIGAGIGAAIWVTWMLAMEPATAAILTAGANVAIGTVFVLRYKDRIRHAKLDYRSASRPWGDTDQRIRDSSWMVGSTGGHAVYRPRCAQSPE